MPNIGLVSYLIGCVSHLALAVFILTRWGSRPGTRQLVVTIVINALWAAVLSFHAWKESLGPVGLILVIEYLRATLWVFLVWRFLFGGDRSKWPRDLAYTVHGTWIVTLLFNVVVWLSHTIGQPLISLSSLYISSMFVMSILGYLLVYQYYRNSSIDDRWQVKFFCLGVGGIFVYDLFVFSLGVLFRGVQSDLLDARGLANAIVAPLIAISVVRMKSTSAEFAVSRKVVFYSTGMLGVGFYLVAIAAGGYFIRIVGGEWGTFALIVFVFSAVMMLLTVIFSGQARARLKVFLDKNFFHHRYDYRKEWLSLTRALSNQESEEDIEVGALRAVCGIVQSPGGTLWQFSNSHCAVTQAWNMSDYAGQIERIQGPFCEFLKTREWIIDKEEYENNQQIYGRLVLPSWFTHDDKSWLILPLLHNDDLTGFIVLARSMAMRKLTWEDRDLLKSVGRQVASHLALHKSAQALAETRQFEAYNRLVAFMMHDLKNLIAQQSLVVRNAAKHKDNPEFIDDAIATVNNSVTRMNRLLDQLRRGDQSSNERITDLVKVVNAVVEQNKERVPSPHLIVENSEIRVRVDGERLTMVLGHLIRNAQDATDKDGTVTLFLGRDSHRAIIEVRDTGCGMEPDFIRDRLFVPFDTTKGSKGMGIGVYQAREFAHVAGGEMQVTSMPGRGSTFRMLIPLIGRDDESALDQESNSGVLN